MASRVATALCLTLTASGCAPRPTLERAASLGHELEGLRQARFKEPPKIEVVDDAAILRVGAAATPAPRDNLFFHPRAWAAFGVPAYRDGKGGPLIEDAIYSFDAHAVYLRWAHQDDSTIVHELDHALQDQRFTVDLQCVDEDRALARRAALEGDAYFTENLWNARRLGIKEREVEEIAALIGDAPPGAVARLFAPRVATASPMARDTVMIPFAAGVAFTAAVHRRGGFGAVDATLARPPESTEQILHPAKYFAHELPIEVATPPVPEGFVIVAAGTVGEARIRSILGTCVPLAEAQAGASGWGGDRYLVVERGDRLALLWRTVWDSPLDAAGFAGALARNSRACPGSKPEHGDVRVRLEGAKVTVVRGLEGAELDRAEASLIGEK